MGSVNSLKQGKVRDKNNFAYILDFFLAPCLHTAHTCMHVKNKDETHRTKSNKPRQEGEHRAPSTEHQRPLDIGTVGIRGPKPAGHHGIWTSQTLDIIKPDQDVTLYIEYCGLDRNNSSGRSLAA